MKGYKVTNADRTRLCGVACSSLQELISKGCVKLNITNKTKLVIQTEDGTIIDDDGYFQTLPAQTTLLFVRQGEHAMTGADIIHNALTAIKREYLRAGKLAQEYLSTNLREKVRDFATILDRHDPRIHKNKRCEDPDWFEGTDTGAQTKERFMFMKSQDRIRGYYYKSFDDVRKSDVYRYDGTARSFLESTFAEFRERLKRHGDFGCYFDRSRDDRERLCDEIGEFVCQGRWDRAKCLYNRNHRINPYESREARVIFSTWNLDHGVERSRTVVPAMLTFAEKAENVPPKQVESFIDAAFYLLYTTHNLKIVHIICHDKGAHDTCSNDHFESMRKILKLETIICDDNREHC